MKNENTENKKFKFAPLKKLKSSRALFVTVCTAAAAVLVIIGFSAYAAAYSNILPNTWTGGCSIGAMSKEEARAELDTVIAKPMNERVLTLTCGENSQSFSFKELGVSLDLDSTVDAAYGIGRHSGVFSKTAALLGAAFRKSDIELSVNVDAEILDSIITALASGYETDVTETSYKLDGSRLVITKGDSGMKVNRESAAESIKKAVTDTKISELTLSPEQTKPSPVNIDELYDKLSAEPRDAYYTRDGNGEVVIADEVPQIIADKKKLKAAFDSKEKVCTVEVKTVMPQKTAAMLRQMLFRDTLSSFSTGFASSTAARAANVSIAASRINGYILMPGDVFSYDKTIGRRTLANGYREAGVYIGNKVESGVGGGICQTSSTLYSAALYANLEIVSRTSHSLPVSYVPAGQDATIAEGAIDLKIKNNTEYPIKIVAAVSGRTVTCKFLGVKVPNQTVELVHTRTANYSPKTERTVNPSIPQGYKKVINRGAPGYAVSSKRIVKVGGEVVKTENLTRSVYNAASIEEEVNPADKDTPSANLAVYTGKIEAEPAEQPSAPVSSGAAPVDADKKPSENTKPSGNAPEASEPQHTDTPSHTETEPKPETVETIGVD